MWTNLYEVHLQLNPKHKEIKITQSLVLLYIARKIKAK
jgi:hypothetical protein